MEQRFELRDMRFLLLFMVFLSTFSVHSAQLAVEPGKLVFRTAGFSFDSRGRTFSFRKGKLSYGRLDDRGADAFLADPHARSFSLGLEAGESVKHGARGIVLDTGLADLSLGLDGYPRAAGTIELEDMKLLLDFRRVDNGDRKFLEPWRNSVDMDVFSFGVMAGEISGLEMVSVLSLSSRMSTEMFTAVAGDFGCIDFRMGVGNTLLSDEDTEFSFSFGTGNGCGALHYSMRSENRSSRPSMYTGSEREMGVSMKLGGLEIGRRRIVSMRPSGLLEERDMWNLDMGFAEFTLSDGKVGFRMEPVSGLSFSVGPHGTDIIFRYGGLSVKYSTSGKWHFRLSVEIP